MVGIWDFGGDGEEIVDEKLVFSDHRCSMSVLRAPPYSNPRTTVLQIRASPRRGTEGEQERKVFEKCRDRERNCFAVLREK